MLPLKDLESSISPLDSMPLRSEFIQFTVRANRVDSHVQPKFQPMALVVDLNFETTNKGEGCPSFCRRRKL